jgi:hypothetical protein
VQAATASFWIDSLMQGEEVFWRLGVVLPRVCETLVRTGSINLQMGDSPEIQSHFRCTIMILVVVLE